MNSLLAAENKITGFSPLETETEISARPTLDDCSEVLAISRSVVGRWRVNRSSIVPLRLHEALLHLPAGRTYELLLFKDHPAYDFDFKRLLKALRGFEGLDLKSFSTNFAGHDKNHGPPTTSIAYVSFAGNQYRLSRLVEHVHFFDEVVLINPFAAEETSIDEVKEILAPDPKTQFLKQMVNSTLAGTLSRFSDTDLQAGNEDQLLNNEFVAEKISKLESERFEAEAIRLGATEEYIKFLGTRNPQSKVYSDGAYFAEFSNMDRAATITLLAAFPKVRLTENRPQELSR